MAANPTANESGPGDFFAAARQTMVAQARALGLRDKAVLAALGRVRRDRFIPAAYGECGDPYGDYPLPIGRGQTISQPFIVGHMIARLALQPGDKVLEIGTGSGYQAAVLAELGARVFSIEYVPELADHARRALAAEGYGAVQVRTGDGRAGWPEEAPFDAIIAACAAEGIPPALVAQLKDGGRMILPVGGSIAQQLILVCKRGDQVEEIEDLGVRFVPMV